MQGSHTSQDATELLATRTGAVSGGGDAMLAPGARLGHYRIESLLGRGGMGEVYRAEQVEPVRRTVALKILPARRIDLRHVAWFEVERQLLAQMRHPAIAQVFDAGTTGDGCPYFAMEYIEGEPVTAFCASRKLPLEQRVALLIRICEGVQHAHQKGVVHRDLKPGNLLVHEVDGRPRPKIIDFGIATASALGHGREVAGTPDYMSPEQAGGDQALVDTRSDVYALGVVLCELLTGQRPPGAGETSAPGPATQRLPSQQFTALSAPEAAQLASRQGRTPSRLRRVLRSDLDHVVAKATHHDRTARYPSAAALAEDLQRFLDQQPLQAVPRRRAYVWATFARRHRAGIAVSGVLLATLFAGLAGSVWGLLQARNQRALAEQRNVQLEKVVSFQRSMLEDIDIESTGNRIATGLRDQVQARAPAALPGLDAALAQASTGDLARLVIDGGILSTADRTLASDFAREPLLAADLREAVAHVRDVLGLPAAAATTYAQVAQAREKQLGASAPAALAARQAQARALLDAGDAKAAGAVASAALGRAAALPAGDATRLRLRLVAAEVVAADGQRQPARTAMEALRKDAIGLRGEDDAVSMEIGNNLAILLARMGEPREGRALLERIVPARERLLGADSREVLGAKHNLAVMKVMTGDGDGAVALQRQLAATRSRRLGAEHPETLGELGNLANMLLDTGRGDEALPIARSVLEARTRVMGAGHPQTMRARLNLSSALARAGQYEQAIALQEEVAAARTALLGPRHPDTLFIEINRAATLFQARRHRDALAQLGRVLPVAERVLGERHPQVQMGYDIRAQAAEGLGDLRLATTSWRHLLDLREASFGRRDARTVDAAWQLEGLMRKENAAAAADELRRAYVLPLLAADVATLDKAQRAKRQDIIDTEAREKTAGTLQ